MYGEIEERKKCTKKERDSNPSSLKRRDMQTEARANEVNDTDYGANRLGAILITTMHAAISLQA